MTTTAGPSTTAPQTRPILDLRGAAAVPLSWLLVVATVVAAGATVLDPGLLHGTAVMNGSARGTALVMLLGGVPLLVAGMLLARRGSVRALALWIGAVAYLGYNGVMLVFGTPFNAMFLAYDAVLGLAIWTAITLLHRVDVDAYATHVRPGARVRAVAVFVWVVVVLNTLAWLGSIVPALTAGWPPAFLVGTGLTTFPTYVQDLAFWLPLFAVAAWWLWRGRAWGQLLVPGLLLYFALEGVGVAVDQVWGHLADPASTVVSPSLAPAFAAVAVVCALLAWHLLAHVAPAHRDDRT